MAVPFMSSLPSHRGLALQLDWSLLSNLDSGQPLCTMQQDAFPNMVLLFQPRLCAQPLSAPSLLGAASLVAQGLDSSQPSSVRYHMALMLSALDVDGAMRLMQDAGTWKVWMWSAMKFVSAKAFG